MAEAGYLVPQKKVRLSDLRTYKAEGTRWAMLTSYDYSTTRAFAAAGIECFLVGDSAANVIFGYDSTTQISLDEMAFLAAGVVRGAGKALVVVDLPFGTYEASDEQAVRSATELIRRSGAHVVKLEGGERMAPRIAALSRAGLAVCAHVGFTPQSVDALSGFKVQGTSEDAAARLRRDVEAVVDAGAAMVVFEMVPAELAAEISAACPIPTIGIGAGPHTDAQVLVWQDMAAVPADSRRPRFVQSFGEAGQLLSEAAAAYKKAVREGSFPAAEHCF
ncbi:3-methyl-2-oxobutanoate hydroxymethyltransferase [Corynebacterium ciconiae DSM 44920]|uniref:3-methyl-2-oxobutanoate hydroxymethyltransferase n=1 Tax=Corynebacterium ciconiae TaxID=227319 RepID=UPI00036C5AEE|nr:3-methyl-2-oxobutanoate hydroxymethyltransferase [Corynebacterium ciconiae]WKD61896.1 3-methyl-2-oxobutanoate hydroxymethyltransferase [Corynebacterium ciconiae DSM 44920]